MIGKIKLEKNLKKYKHSSETMQIINKNNKENSCKYIVKIEDKEFIGNMKECSKYLGLDISSIYNKLNKKHESKLLYTIEKIKNQKKKLKLYINETFIIFNSLSDCDKYFNMWRGYTSNTIKKQDLIKGLYNYTVI